MKDISVAIIGLGYWGPNYARIITQLENVKLKWCYDNSKSALRKFSKLYPSIQTSESLDTLLNDNDLNAAIVVTPAQSHYEITKKFLLKGKDVLVEKPLTNNLNESKQLVNLAKKKRRILMVDHTFLFNAAIIKLKKLIEAKELGKIYYIYGNYNALGPIRKDVSAMWDLPHLIYIVNFLLGTDPIWVQASGKDYLQKNMEDIVFLNFEYRNQILVNLNCSWIDPVKVRKLVVVGEKKMVTFDDMEPEEKIKIYDKGVEITTDPNFADLQLIVRNGDTLIPKLTLKEPLKEIVLEFTKSIRARKNNVASGENGLSLVKILTYAQESLKKGGQRIYLK